MATIQSRRRFVTNAAAAGTADFGGFGIAGVAAGEHRCGTPPEIWRFLNELKRELKA